MVIGTWEKHTMLQDPSIDDMEAASPGSIFAAENGKVETAIEVLSEEAKHVDCDWMREELEAVALYLETEVLK